MSSVPVRAGPPFAATDTDTMPLPAPLAPLVTVSQLSTAFADHVQVVNAVTVKVVVAASDETDWVDGETEALHGGGATATPLTATRSNVVTDTASVVWLDTPSPMNTFAAIAIVSVPTSFQVVPSAEWEAVNVLPLRSSRTQYGAAKVVLPVVLTDVPLVVKRRWNAVPFAADSSMNACVDPGASDSRIITPAFTHTLVF